MNHDHHLLYFPLSFFSHSLSWEREKRERTKTLLYKRWLLMIQFYIYYVKCIFYNKYIDYAAIHDISEY